MIVGAGSTDVTTYFVLRKAADGTELTAATIANIDMQYCRSGASPVAKVDCTALAATNTAHTDNYGIEIDATDQPGLYRIDWPDAAFAVGVREVILTVLYATALTAHLRVELNPAVDAVAISGDTTAADNCEADYDGTGYVGGTIKKEADVVSIHGTALTETATQLAGAFTKFFNVASPTGTVNSIPDAVAGANLGLQICGSNAATTYATLTSTGAFTTGSRVFGNTTMGTLTQTGAVSWGATTFASMTTTGAFTNGSTVLGNTTAGTITQTGAASWGATTIASVAVTGALSVGTTTTLTGAVSLGGALGVTGTTTLAAVTQVGAVSLGATTVASLTITGAASVGTTTTLTGAVSTGAVTLNGLAITNALSVGTTTTLTGAVSLGSTLGVTGATTLASLSVTGQLDAGNVLVDTTTVLTGTLGVGATTLASLAITGSFSVGTTTTLTGAVSLGSTLGITGAATLASLSVTGQLDAGNVLIDAATVLTGAVSMGSTFAVTGAITAPSITLTGTLQAATIVSTGTTTLNALTVTNALTSGTNVVPWNATWDTEVQSECEDAIAANASIAAILADTAGRKIQKNVALANFEFLMIDSADHFTPIAGLGADITCERSIDGAAFAACANAAAEVANGIYKISLAATDLNGDVITLKFTHAGADATYITIATQA